MHQLDNLASLRVNRSVALSIGVFDGVHLGHQHLISDTLRRARDRSGLAVVLTFHPHPRLVLSPSLQPAYINTLDERLRLIADLGVDLTVTMRFSRQMAQLSAREFVEQLCRAFPLVDLVVGPDFALGHKRQGTIPVLREMGQELGFEVSVAEPWQSAGQIVSSTRVRQLVREGDVAGAAMLLTRPCQLTGMVVEGDKRGRTLGFPTANLTIDPEMLLPADGVYAVSACLDGTSYAAVCNIGRRPSFENAKRSFEVHLLDFDGEVYGKQITVKFAERLRGEVRFPSAAALITQIQADITQARGILGSAAGMATTQSDC